MIGADHTPVKGSNEGAASGAAESAAPAERWVAEHGDVLWRFVLGRTRSRDVAEEIVQETILAAMEGLGPSGDRGSERTWLLGIAAHKVADHFRRRRRQVVIAEAKGGPGGAGRTLDAMFDAKGCWANPPGAWGARSADAAADGEVLAALRRCIDALPPSLSEAVWLRDLLGMPTKEVCKVMGLTPTNLWTRAHRARAALRLCVEQAMGIGKKGPR